MSTLPKTAPELNDLSVLILADLFTTGDKGRKDTRITTLLGTNSTNKAIQTLLERGLIEARRLRNGSVPKAEAEAEPHFHYTLTPKGFDICRTLLNTLRAAA